MGKKNIYYLIKRDKQTNEYCIVPVNGVKGTALEEIDLYVINNFLYLSVDEDLTLRPGGSYDWFIASVSGDGKNIRYMELPSNYRDLVKIAQASLDGKIDSCSSEINRIYTKFDLNMKTLPAFRKYVLKGNTDIYEKFYRYFIRKGYVNYHQDGDWAFKSYPLIRSVASSLNGDYTYTLERKDDLLFRRACRQLLDKSILNETNPDYDENQLSFLEDLPMVMEEKKLEIFSMLEALPQETFIINSGHVIFNDLAFPSFERRDLSFLKELLPEKVRLMIYYFSLHHHFLNEDTDKDKWKKMIKRDIQNISSWLDEDDSNFDRINQWFELYGKYVGRTIGDQCARYRKEKKQPGVN